MLLHPGTLLRQDALPGSAALALVVPVQAAGPQHCQAGVARVEHKGRALLPLLSIVLALVLTPWVSLPIITCCATYRPVHGIDQGRAVVRVDFRLHSKVPGPEKSLASLQAAYNSAGVDIWCQGWQRAASLQAPRPLQHWLCLHHPLSPTIHSHQPVSALVPRSGCLPKTARWLHAQSCAREEEGYKPAWCPPHDPSRGRRLNEFTAS